MRRSVRGRSLPANQRCRGSHSHSSAASGPTERTPLALAGRRGAVFVFVTVTHPFLGARSRVAADPGRGSGEPEPVEAVAREGEQVGQFTDGGETDSAEQLDGVAAVVAAEVEF